MSNIFTRPGSQPRGSDGGPRGGGLPIVPLVILGAIVLVIFMAWRFRTIDQGEVGVTLRWGEAVGILQPGLSIVWPGLERVVVLTTRTQKRTYEKVNSYSRDIQQADNLVSV